MFCMPGLVFGCKEGLGSRFHVLRSRTSFRRCRVLRVSFSGFFTRPDSFSAVPRVSGLDFRFCALGLVFGGSEGVVSRLHFSRARTHFRRYQERRVPFSCFALPNSFSDVLSASGPVFMFCAMMSASGPVFMFCAPGLVLGST
jgi:hypothetical protein